MAKGGAPSERNKGIQQEMLELQQKCDAKLAEWHEHNIDPSGVGINGFTLDAKVSAILDILKEKLEISEEELNLYHFRRMLKELTEGLERFLPEVQQARSQALEQAIRPQPAEVTQLFGPNNRPIKE